MKLSNWRDRLRRVFDEAHDRRFRWGQHDCCQFTARCSRAVTGQERRGLFPRYLTKQQATAILDREGGMRALMVKAFGTPVHVLQAGDGDIVLINTGAGEQPAVILGGQCFMPGRRNLISWPVEMATAAWIL